jgi:hypothetical protein
MADTATIDVEFDAPEFTDAELTELALAADPDAPIDPDAEPWSGWITGQTNLPEWYMPAPLGGQRGWKAKALLVAVVAAIVFINMLGLCVTYGRVQLG